MPDPCHKCRGNWRRVRIWYKGGEIDTQTRCSCARGRLLTDQENEERRKEGRSEVRMLPGTMFLDDCDADLADMHGFSFYQERMQ